MLTSSCPPQSIRVLMTANWGLVLPVSLVGVYSYNGGEKIGKDYFLIDSPSYFWDVVPFSLTLDLHYGMLNVLHCVVESQEMYYKLK